VVAIAGIPCIGWSLSDIQGLLRCRRNDPPQMVLVLMWLLPTEFVDRRYHLLAPKYMWGRFTDRQRCHRRVQPL
jgi:hypothetical protein